MQALDIPTVVDTVRTTFASDKTRPLAWRRQQLERLRDLVLKEEARLVEALRADMGKPEFEAFASEVGYLVPEIGHTLRHLKRWMKPEKVPTPMLNFKATSRIHREPLGVVLIIGPWNYPIQLLLAPLIGALAAGNCAVLKPSEITTHSASLMAELIPKYLDPEAVVVIEGGIPETTTLLAERFDHIFFTGSTMVGKIIMQAAAKHLTPVTLELGGKSPCFVDKDVDLEVASRRIVWGKFFNAGQTCVAPDYILVDKAMEQPLLDKLKETVTEFYGADPKQSPDFARIVNTSHHERLSKLIADGEPVTGGQTDEAERYIAPTILTKVKEDSNVMAEEIFGPILPVLPVEDVHEAIRFITARPKPLALYVFSNDAVNQQKLLVRTSSGGACLNDTVSHLAVPDLPFGGVGESGMGAYHGRASFETFSHRKSVLDRATWVDLKLRYPPYEGSLRWVKKLLGVWD